VSLLHAVAFSNYLLWFAQTKVNTLKTRVATQLYYRELKIILLGLEKFLKLASL